MENSEKSKLIFVSSPYSDDPDEGTKMARRYCRIVTDQGHIPFAPHLIYTQFLDDSNENERKIGIAAGLAFLGKCDELWAFGENMSRGMKLEINEAIRLGLPVLYLDKNGERGIRV